MRQPEGSRSAFTLIELMITMLVMGILAAIITPSYHAAIARYQAGMAARRIVADLQYARSEAQRTSQSRTVQFDPASNLYSLVGVADLNSRSNVFDVSLEEPPYRVILVSASFGGVSNVVFDMYGRPDSNGTIVVQSGSAVSNVNLASDGSLTVY